MKLMKKQLLKNKDYRKWLAKGSRLAGTLFFVIFYLVVMAAPNLATAQTAPASNSPVPASTRNAGQSGTGSITGKISNGTAGKMIPAGGQVIKLEQFTENNEKAEENQVLADSSGNFVFQKLPVGESYTYYVSTLYAGVTYYVQAALKLTAAQPAQTAELKVYETGGDPGVVSIASTSLVIPQVDATNGLISVLEMYSIQNRSDRTYIGQNKGQAATPGLPPTSSNQVQNASSLPTLRFFLPTGATGINPAAGLSPGDIIETSDGIELTTPILPGESQIVFGYQLAYQEETFTFNKRLAYDTPSLRFFTPVSGPKATSSQLVVGQPMQMGQQQLATLSGQNLKANSQLQIKLAGLPLPPDKGTLATRDTLLKVIVAVLGIGAIGFLILYSRPRSGTLVASNVNSSEITLQNTALGKSLAAEEAERERRRLIYQLAKLDYNFAKGEVVYDEADYRERRSQLMSELLIRWPQSTTPAATANLAVQAAGGVEEETTKNK